jgi:hypothetical protein
VATTFGSAAQNTLYPTVNLRGITRFGVCSTCLCFFTLDHHLLKEKRNNEKHIPMVQVLGSCPDPSYLEVHVRTHGILVEGLAWVDTTSIGSVSAKCLEGVEIVRRTGLVGIPCGVDVVLGGLVPHLFVIFSILCLEEGCGGPSEGRVGRGKGRCRGHESSTEDKDLGVLRGQRQHRERGDSVSKRDPTVLCSVLHCPDTSKNRKEVLISLTYHGVGIFPLLIYFENVNSRRRRVKRNSEQEDPRSSTRDSVLFLRRSRRDRRSQVRMRASKYICHLFATCHRCTDAINCHECRCHARTRL